MKNLFALSCLILLTSSSITSVCPVWKCEPKDSEDYQGNCVYKDGDIIRAGPFCGGMNKGCLLLDWYENGHEKSLACPTSLKEEEVQTQQETPSQPAETPSQPAETPQNQETQTTQEPVTQQEQVTPQETATQETTTQETSTSQEAAPAESEQNSSPQETSGATRRRLGLDYQYITVPFIESYCQDDKGNKKNWTVEASCAAFCAPKNNSRFLLFADQIQCDYEKFVEARQSSDPSFNEGKADGWSNCTTDSDCMSNACDCVPSADGLGRCKSTYEDRSYEIFFNFACEETDHSDYWDNACAYWINVQLGHFLEAITKNVAKVRCLVDYGDYQDFYKVQGEIAEDTWWIYVIVISALVALIISIWCCVKLCKGSLKREDKRANPYGRIA